MPYASLHEAFTPYSDNISSSSGVTSNPSLLNQQWGGDRGYDLASNGDLDDIRDIRVETVREKPVQHDPITAFDALSASSSVRTPVNQSNSLSPLDVRESTGYSKPPYLVEPKFEARAKIEALERELSKLKEEELEIQGGRGRGRGNSIVKGFDCSSDGHCMDLIDHILSCDDCAEKLKKLLSLGGNNNIFGFEINNENMSKLVFYFILLLLVVAMYELLNSLLRRIVG